MLTLRPLTVALSSILGVPFIAASFVGSKFRSVTVREAP